ncbi:MAG: hypothetical protein ACJ79P_14305 [Myxococcales bacterium]
MKRAAAVAWLAAAAGVPSLAFGQTSSRFQPRFEVVPVETDNGAGAVAAFWRYGLGCPPGPAGFGCPNPFQADSQNQGLILAKSVQSFEPPKAIAEIRGVKGTFLAELGYDLRKFSDQFNAAGSECTVTSPRFEFTMADGSSFFIPCQQPTLDEPVSLYWRRLRWDAAEAAPNPTPILACPMPVRKGASCNVQVSCPNPKLCGLDKRMQTLRIVQDVGPDSDNPTTSFGLSVFDNIDVNGKLVGTGPGPRNGDEDEGQGRDKDGREFYHRDSPSHPEQGVFEFHDPVANFNLIGTGGVLGIAYSVGPLGAPCVSFSGNGIVNGGSTYRYTFLSCDLSAVGTDLGTYSITATGPLGTLPYTQTGSLVTGSISIHPH